MSDQHPSVRRNYRKQKNRFRPALTGIGKDGSLYFVCFSGTKVGVFWRQRIICSDLPYIKEMMLEDKSISEREAVQLALSGDLLTGCNCPAERYYFSYIAWNLGMGIRKETRFPKVRNPRLLGTTCKHLLAILEELPRFVGVS